MQQVAQVLQLGLNALVDPHFISVQFESLNELLPIDQSIHLIVAVVQQQVDFFRSNRDVERADCLLEL